MREDWGRVWVPGVTAGWRRVRGQMCKTRCGGLAASAQMCTCARALQLCLLPQMWELPAHPELIPSSSQTHPELARFASPGSSKAGGICGFLSAPGSNAPVRGPRCYSWLCRGLIGPGRASSLLPRPLMWAACEPRDAAGSWLAPGMGESKDKAPF